MIRKIFYNSFIIVSLIVSSAVYAQPANIEYTAVIEYISDPGFALEGRINIGDSMNGVFGYDADIPDNDPNPSFAQYFLPPPTPIELGFMFDVSGMVLNKLPDSDLNIYIHDDTVTESFHAMSCCQVGFLTPEIMINNVIMDLNYSDGSALDGASLGSLQNLAAFQDKIIFINGTNILTGTQFDFVARITNIVNPPPVCVSCAFPPAPDHRAYTAIVRELYDPSNQMASYFAVGNKISGVVRFNPNVPSSYSSPEFAAYDFPPGDPSVGLSLSFAGQTVNSAPNATNLGIYIGNQPSYGNDMVDIVSWYNQIPLPNGAVIQDIIISTRDRNGQTLSTTTLAEGLNVPIQGWSDREVMIHGNTSDGSTFHIVADIVSFEQEEISLSPITVAPGSGSIVMGQNFDIGIVISAGQSPIQEVILNMTDYAGNPIPTFCYPGPVSSSGRQTAICPGNSWAINPGVNLFYVEIKFVDGTTLRKSGYWEAVGY